MQKIRDIFVLMRLRNSTTNEVIVVGNSMFPYVQEGDKVSLEKKPLYEVGDIIVFTYANNLLIHRIIAKYNGFMLCKGDNSFAIEKVLPDYIFGKAITIERNGVLVSLPSMDNEFYKLSIAINRIYCASNYDIERTKSSNQYRLFYKKYIENIYTCNKIKRDMVKW